MNPVTVIPGSSPIVLAQPHSGTFVPEDIRATLTARGGMLADTDWHVPQLYDGLLPDATIVRAEFNRYVIDANRPPDGASLYPGQNTTGLVPMVDFENHPLWQEEPDEAEIARRRKAFHAPYHAALRAEIDRVRGQHGFAVLYDCHSIQSCLPFLFEGRLPDLNIGTDNGATCAPAIEREVAMACANGPYSYVVNGRFRGGWTTRHYGEPDRNIHAIQMEIAQSTYLEAEEPPFAFSPDKAADLRDTLAEVFAGIESTFGELA
ncbi:N-formylglutamate deformylase [Qipengyuania qiaonensis]|uniref:N-formylglutamate deformylase n=1 Tax=Qipengyuania qiaonensis TaxID=2867240 RepID=A0ABS7JA88_9SPHN|nr:N-formylglutamate deformylase [Qipengyuania qiaonensis]MBX7482774.1 N-formylglutamate deformylase [Qipengyuania qiaonensis]